MIRLQKFLSEAGVASRRKSEEYITEGRISVNGKIVTELGTRVSENDTVCFDGKRVQIDNNYVYYMLNKPEGCVTTADDQFGRKTVLDYINSSQRLYPVGRLDYNTSGLLIITNDGSLTYALTHPKHNVEKTYIAQVEGEITEKGIERLRNGIFIDGRKTAKAKAEKISEDTIKISIKEGRNRQVRKMCSAIGNNVIRLKRISIGELTLGSLEKGRYRCLSENEIQYLKSISAVK